MTNRIQDILSFIDNDEQQASTTPSTNATQDATPDASQDASQDASPPTTTQIPKPNISNNTSTIDLNMFNDDKMYNKFSRQMKKNKFPMIFEGKILNDESEAIAFKNDILNHRKENRKMLRQQKIQNSKMKFDAMPTVDENKDSEYYEQDGMIYQVPKSPYAVVKDGVKRVIPKTSKKDTKAIAETIKKHGGKEAMKNLVKAESEDRFQEISSDIINSSSDEEVKNSYYNHVNNNLASDQTWNQASFLKMMYNMMKENEELKSNAAKYQQQIESAKPKRMQSGLNPALFKR